MQVTDKMVEAATELWDDATNAVCQSMQERNMCNCPDGDCLASKIEIRPTDLANFTAALAHRETEAVAWQSRQQRGDGSWSLWSEVHEDTAAALASLNRTDIQVRPLYAAPPAVPEGMVLVPVEPTRSHLERLAKMWGYTLEETADSYAGFLEALTAAQEGR